MFTNLRIRSIKLNENAGEWHAEKVLDYHWKVLKECQDAEPDAEWTMETRGLSSAWHKYVDMVQP